MQQQVEVVKAKYASFRIKKEEEFHTFQLQLTIQNMCSYYGELVEYQMTWVR